MSPRTVAVRCPCGTPFRRPVGRKHEAQTTCLRCEFSARLAAAGVRWDDPALLYIADWNASARERSGDAVRAHEAKANLYGGNPWPKQAAGAERRAA